MFTELSWRRKATGRTVSIPAGGREEWARVHHGNQRSREDRGKGLKKATEVASRVLPLPTASPTFCSPSSIYFLHEAPPHMVMTLCVLGSADDTRARARTHTQHVFTKLVHVD